MDVEIKLHIFIDCLFCNFTRLYGMAPNVSTLKYRQLWKFFIHFRVDFENFILELCFFTTKYDSIYSNRSSHFSQKQEPLIKNRYRQVNFSCI